jgi:hypothetical protein
MSAHRLLVLVGVALLGGCGGGGSPHPRATPAARRAEPRPAAAWTHATVLRRLAGRQIRAGGRTVKIDPGTVTCVGVSVPTRREGRPAWTAFRCVQPTFPPGAVVGPDAVFDVRPTGETTFAVVGARLTHY